MKLQRIISKIITGYGRDDSSCAILYLNKTMSENLLIGHKFNRVYYRANQFFSVTIEILYKTRNMHM